VSVATEKSSIAEVAHSILEILDLQLREAHLQTVALVFECQGAFELKNPVRRKYVQQGIII